MCTRFYIEKEDTELFGLMEAAKRSSLNKRFFEKFSKSLKTEGEVRPTDIAAVLAPDRNGKRAVFPMKWGFTFNDKSAPVVNARMETASSKSMFKEAWERRRCVIPASWFYEWEHIPLENGGTKTGAKYLIQPKDSTLTWLCGLYRLEDGLPVFTVLTRDSSPDIDHIHDRMPLILPKEKIDDWLNVNGKPEEVLAFALSAMIAEKT